MDTYLEAPEMMTRKNQILLKHIDRLNQDMKNQEVKQACFKWCTNIRTQTRAKSRHTSPFSTLSNRKEIKVVKGVLTNMKVHEPHYTEVMKRRPRNTRNCFSVSPNNRDIESVQRYRQAQDIYNNAF